MTAIQSAPTIQTPPAPEAIIHCAGLTKVFKDFWWRNRDTAVDALDLEVRRGEVFGLLGPNGSGKSTTIKMILGLLHPSAGRIAVFGKRPDDVATKKLIGYLPEESYLYRFLNARETLEYYGRLFHQNGEQRRRRIDQLLEFVGLEGVQRRPVGEYSKGMQRRIGLAQALINDPQLLILDEPTTGMDVEGRRDFWAAIRDDAERGRTVVFATHYLEEADAYADRIVLVSHGRVVADGTAAEIKAQSSGRLITATWEGVGTAEAVTLRSLAGVEDVELRGDTVLVRAKDSDSVARHLLTTTPARDLQITSRGLEDAFLALTGDNR
jgi:ABC-2 type transport system ATP-binding protein